MKILVVDDELEFAQTLRDALEEEGYQADVTSNQNDALLHIEREDYDVALIDVRLQGHVGDKSGIILAMALQKFRPQISIIMLSKYVSTDQAVRTIHYHGVKIKNFIDKGNADWFPHLLNALQDTTETPMHNEPDTVFAYVLFPHARVVARTRGQHTRTAIGEQTLQLNPLDYQFQAALAEDNPDYRRRIIKNLGRDLWNQLFASHPKVKDTFQDAHANTRARNSILSLQFEISREYGNLPLEFIHPGDGEFLVLEHPFSRLYLDIYPKRQAISPHLLSQKKELRILLIASNTLPAIPGVDEEVLSLRGFFSTQKSIPVQYKVIQSSQATYENVTREIKTRNYDIIHYAGHGRFDHQHPETSSIYFWKQENKEGGLREITAAEFKTLLDRTNVHFVYLSNCYGAASGDRDNLYTNDFLGIADAVIQAGIPSVLGYRWPVSDTGAIKLAREFYHFLFEYGSPDIALWLARRELAGNRDDTTWLSPILIHQA